MMPREDSPTVPDQDQGATALKQIRTWALSCFGLGLVIAAATLLEPGESRYASFIEGDSAQVIGVGLGLCLFAAIAFMLRARLAKLLAVPADSQDSLLKDHPYAALFLVSLVILFIEVMFIRYTSSQLRIFAFYKNIPLISCFLGLGLGCFLRNGGSRHVLWFLLWILPLTAFLSQGALLVDNTLSVWGAAAFAETRRSGTAALDSTPGSLSVASGAQNTPPSLPAWPSIQYTRPSFSCSCSPMRTGTWTASKP